MFISRTLFQNVCCPAVSGLIIWPNSISNQVTRNPKILLIKRGNYPMKGKWAFPGGKVNFGEAETDAVVREVMEETGLTILVKKKIGEQKYNSKDSIYSVSVYTGQVYPEAVTLPLVRAADDAADVTWLTLEELQQWDTEKLLVPNLMPYAKRGVEEFLLSSSLEKN